MDDPTLDFVVIWGGEPFRITKLVGEYWMCYMHPDKRWVTLRKINSAFEMARLVEACIEWKHRELYEFGLPFSTIGWPNRPSEALANTQ